MPLRILEASVPGDDVVGVSALLESVPTVQVWSYGSDDGSGLIRVLLDSAHTEAASDLLVGRYGSAEGFRLTLLAVEATIPPVEQPTESQKTEGPEGPAGSVGAVDSASESTKPPVPRISREELYSDVAEACAVNRVYVAMVVLSTLVAAVGLIRGDVAVIIGAMVIAPLLGPNIGLALAVSLGDTTLARQSFRAIFVGVGIASALSLLLGAVLTIDPTAPELAARTGPQLSDVAVAMAAGAAGTLAFTSGVPAVVVGVMVAVALLPPLVAAGLLLGAGQWSSASGAMVLLLTNVTCVNLAAMAAFYWQEVRPRTYWEADRAKRAVRRAAVAWAVLLALLIGLVLSGRIGGALVSL
jgi:uncharacterized hydrophobic protein (TIGR00341 family)